MPELELYDIEDNRLYLTGDKRCAFYDAAMQEPGELRTFCHTLHDTGVRISEALALRPLKVDLSEKAIIVRSLKKRDKVICRAVPVNDAYLDALELA